MAEIKDCIGNKVKIGKCSITIKSKEGKTCGVVRNIISLYDLQPNKQMEYYSKLKKIGLHGKVSIKNCIIKDDIIYIFRNIKSKLFHEKYGFLTDKEYEKEEEQDTIYNMLKDNGIEVIECLFM